MSEPKNTNDDLDLLDLDLEGRPEAIRQILRRLLVASSRTSRALEKVSEIEASQAEAIKGLSDDLENLSAAVWGEKKVGGQLGHEARLKGLEESKQRGLRWYELVVGGVVLSLVAALVGWVLSGGLTS